VYQAALQAKGNDPWLLVGMAHIQSLEGADVNAVKQNLELAITSALGTKGKLKGKPSPEIVNAIGRVFAELPSNVGDHTFAVDKINEIVSYPEVNNPNLFLNLGINYLKLGGDHGGEAVKAFLEAINKDPKNAYAYYRIGKIYQTQSNKESLEENYKKAIEIDATIAPVYLSLYTFYADKNTDIAKANLDLFLKNADKDPAFDYLNADYLFQAGQYDASLAKATELEKNIGIDNLPRIAVLLAYNYDRKGDSVQSRKYIENFFKVSPAEKVLANDYDIAVKVLSKFPGTQDQVVDLLTKAIAADSTKPNRMKYYKLGADMLAKAGKYADQAKWYASYAALRGAKDEAYYYQSTTIALNALDGAAAQAFAKEYITNFPERPNGYSLNLKAARLLDSAHVTGVYFEAAKLQNETIYSKDPAKFKNGLISNYYTMMAYYNERKDLENAIAMCDKVLEIFPGEPQTTNIKASLVKNLEISKKNAPKDKQKPDAQEPKKN
jgi:tetratricopeptide (TPR) repeat protein